MTLVDMGFLISGGEAIVPLMMTDAQLEGLGKYLEGPDGCNLHLHNPDDPSTMTWDCDGTLRKTVAYMQAQSIDIATNIVSLVAEGGYCDCEILLNALDTTIREHGIPLPNTMVRVAYDADRKLRTVMWSAHGLDAQKLLDVAQQYVGVHAKDHVPHS